MRLTLFAALIWIPTAFPAPVRADGPVLHEPLPPVPAGRQRASVVLYDEQRGDDSLPEAIEVNGDVLQRPQFLSAAQRAEITRDGRFRTATDARPDLQTEREEQLNYRTIFQPSILPFKRGMALSEIQPDGTLTAPGEPLREVSVVGNVPSRGRDMFWADLDLNLTVGVPSVIPTVSPDSRVLSYEASPNTHLRFHKDTADNLYVTSSRSGRIHLVMLTDAPQSWFGGRVSDVALSDLPPLDSRLPSDLQAQAKTALKHLGLTREASFRDALARLVAYFRDFRSGKLARKTDSLLVDVVLSQTGICRHRSHWFVVLARALGIHARYVHNEAHAFVEVQRAGPEKTWLRIDLGGDAERFEAFGAEGKVRHQASQSDPFDRPANYREGSGQPAGARQASGLPATSRSSLSEPGLSRGNTQMEPHVRPVNPLKRAGRIDTSTSATISSDSVFRGDRIRVSGSVTAEDGTVVSQGSVQVVLRLAPDVDCPECDRDKPASTWDGDHYVGHSLDELMDGAPTLLGTAELTVTGDYIAEVRIPSFAGLGRHEIFVEFLGSPRHNPSRSP